MNKTYVFASLSIFATLLGVALLMEPSFLIPITDGADDKNSPAVQTQSNVHVAVSTNVNDDAFAKKEKQEEVRLTNNIAKPTDIEKFLTSKAFDSRDHFDKAFISEKDVVSNKTIRILFEAQNFTRVIEKARALDNDHTKVQNEENLYTQFSKLVGEKFYAENYVCSGKICLIEFNYNDTETTQAQLEKMRNFGSNHSFSSYTPSDNEDMIYRGLFIATDDPTTLTMSRD